VLLFDIGMFAIAWRSGYFLLVFAENEGYDGRVVGGEFGDGHVLDGGTAQNLRREVPGMHADVVKVDRRGKFPNPYAFAAAG